MRTLVTVPSPETIERLQQIFTSAPISIDWTALLVPLAYLPSDVMVEPDNSLRYGSFKDFSVQYDAFRQTAELVGVLDSPEMQKRSIDCGMDFDFRLKMVFLPYAPAQSLPIRRFIISVSDTLVAKEQVPFSFKNEFVLK